MRWSGEYAADEHYPLFRDRQEAGRELATHLRRYQGSAPVVLGIPRGGVVVAAEVAHALDGELDVVIARKLGAPGAPELAIGAVTADGGQYLNHEIIKSLGVRPDWIEWVTSREMAEARRREGLFRGGRPSPALEGRTVIIVDDGLATGATVHAAVNAVRNRKPARVVVAAPVGAPEACTALWQVADDVVCPYVPDPFGAIGRFYQHFDAVDEADVERLLYNAATIPV
ncbi:MAG TPA: phosphoribosyltransferase family protein [Gemmatimonadales bacterium]